jgi:hypothetical protein
VVKADVAELVDARDLKCLGVVVSLQLLCKLQFQNAPKPMERNQICKTFQSFFFALECSDYPRLVFDEPRTVFTHPLASAAATSPSPAPRTPAQRSHARTPSLPSSLEWLAEAHLGERRYPDPIIPNPATSKKPKKRKFPAISLSLGKFRTEAVRIRYVGRSYG